MLWKKLIGAAKMRPRCSESVTRRCFTKFGSLDLIPGAQRAPIAKKMVREEEELQAPVPYLLIWHPPVGMASEASTCNGLVIEGGYLSSISHYANHSGCRIGMGNLDQSRIRSRNSYFQEWH